MTRRPFILLVLSLALGLAYPTTSTGYADVESAALRLPTANWLPVVEISHAHRAAYGPQLAVDVQGTTYALWADESRGWADVMFASQPREGNWSDPIRISDLPGPFVLSEYHLIVEPSGVVHVTWVAGNTLYYARRTADGVWSASAALTQPMAGLGDVQIMVDPQGTLHLALAAALGNSDRSAPVYHDIYYTSRPAGGSWTTPVDVSHSSWDSTSPVLALDGSSTQLLWLETTAQGVQQVFFAGQTASGDWSDPEALAPADGQVRDLQFVVVPQPNGSPAAGSALASHRLVAIWTQANAVGTNVVLVERPAGASWTSAAHLLPGAGMALDPHLLALPDGSLHLVWRACSTATPGCADGTVDLYYAIRLAGKGWGGVNRVFASRKADTGAPVQLAADSQGALYLAWMESTHSGMRVLLATRQRNAWNQPLVIGSADGANIQATQAKFGQLAFQVDGLGRLHLAWSQEVNGKPAVFARVSPPGPLLDLPVDYPGRGSGSMAAFRRAFVTRIDALFDHSLPLQADGQTLSFIGIPYSNAAGLAGCQPVAVGCYDGHEGYDFLPAPGDASTVILPAAPGRVVEVQADPASGPYGEYVDVDHGNGYRTRYAHLSSISATLAATVTITTPLGLMGSTGHSTGTHLHLNVYYQGHLVDPSGWFGSGADPWAQQPEGARSDPLWLFPIHVEKWVDGTAAGEAALDPGIVSASIPAGLYAGPLDLALTVVPAEPADTQPASGYAWMFNAITMTGAQLDHFDRPLTLRVVLSPESMPGLQLSSATLLEWNDSQSSWQPLPSRVDGSILSATVIRPGIIVVEAQPAGNH